MWLAYLRERLDWPLSRVSVHRRSKGGSDRFSLTGSSRSHEENTRPAQASVCLNHIRPLLANYFSAMTYLAPHTSSLKSPEGIGQGVGRDATSGEAQQQRYASFSCYAYWLVSQRVTAHILHRSTSSMTIPFSMYSISIGRLFYAKMAMAMIVSR
jgi:hypothetical protein